MALVAPLMFLGLHFVFHPKGVTVVSEIGLTALYAVAGVSFFYLMERASYNRAKRQLSQKSS